MLSALRSLGIGVWRLGERLGLNVIGASEGPRSTNDPSRQQALERLVQAARAGDGTLDAAASPFPAHALLTYLVDAQGLLLHGSNHTTLDVLEPQPAADFDTSLHAVVACDDGIWPIFYAVVARDRVDGVLTACTHLGRGSRRRRFYLFAVFGDAAAPETWTDGVVYALPRDGFRREWGNEWVCPTPVRPLLRVHVRPDDFPLRDTVVGLGAPLRVRDVIRRLRAAKRERAATP